MALERQGAREPGLKVQYPDPAGRDGDASHGLSPQRTDPRRTLLRPEIPGCRTVTTAGIVTERDGNARLPSSLPNMRQVGPVMSSA